MERKDLITAGWEDYELLDSGDNQKLERYGAIIVSRPEPQALWKRSQPELWKKADATFAYKEGKGKWDAKSNVPDQWNLKWNDVSFIAKLTSFKHVGIFPEQAANWAWIEERVKALQNPKILNLFGYTGIASVVAAKAGGAVTHVDASKQSLDWAHDNARLSNIEEGQIKYLFEDAIRFAKREVRRGSKYEGIILDPPAFGRGSKGEVWKIEEGLPELVELTKQLLSEIPNPFYLLNGYAAGYSSLSFAQLVKSTFVKENIEYGELLLSIKDSEKSIANGIYARF